MFADITPIFSIAIVAFVTYILEQALVSVGHKFQANFVVIAGWLVSFSIVLFLLWGTIENIFNGFMGLGV